MDDRYHLTLTLDGRLAMQGWWADKGTAERKFSSWVGERGDMPGARIVLTDTADGRVIHSWSEES